MKKIIFTLFLILIVSCSEKQANQASNVNMGVIPKPLSSRQLNKAFKLSDDVSLIVKSKNKKILFTAKYLQEKLNTLSGLQLHILSEQNKADRTIVLMEKKLDNESNNEAYQLEVSKNRITITGESVGLFYGVQTLLQIIQKVKTNKIDIEIPGYSINDKPRFSWRGMHLDVSRHFFNKEDIKKYIDILAMHKINIFHWHLTDDQGWRIEIKKYPKLTTIGAWREDTSSELWNLEDNQREPSDNRGVYGGFYTQDDIREIVAYALQRGITIVPEIEMPGHSAAALVAYPEYSCFGLQKHVPSGGYVGENWGFSDPYCAGNEETFVFLQNVLDEVLELFPSKYIHIGGDECSKNRWSQCPKCQERIKSEGLKDEYELQSYFIHRIEKHLKSKGRKIIGWEEILEGGINSSSIIMPWKYETALKVSEEAARNGNKVIMSPSKYTYFNSQWPNDKAILKRDLSLETVYSYLPISSELDTSLHSSIYGLEGCVWTEHIKTLNDIEYQSVLRIAALAEVGWTYSENINFTDFKHRLNDVKAIYRNMDINYHVPSSSLSDKKTIFIDSFKIKIDLPLNGLATNYTTNGEQPTINSKEYKSEFWIDKTTHLKVANFDKYGKSSRVKDKIFEKQNYLSPVVISNVEKGIRYKTFTGKIRSANLRDAKIKDSGIINKIELPKDKISAISGMEFTGYIKVPTDNIYTFSLASSDGSILKIGSDIVIDNDGFPQISKITTDEHGNKTKKMILKPGSIALKKGLHPIKIKYFKWENKKNKDILLFIESKYLKKQEVDDSTLFHNK